MRRAISRLAGVAALFLGLVACETPALPGLSSQSVWGGERAGLRIRAGGPLSAARGDDVAIDVQFEVRESRLQHGGLRLDRRNPATFARLVLTPAAGGKRLIVRADDPAAGLPDPPFADGTWPVWNLVDGAPDPVTITFGLARIWDDAPVGSYSVVLQLDFPADSHGSWVGPLRSAPFDLYLTPSTGEGAVFAAPTRLRLSGRDVFYGDEDIEEVVVQRRNGFTVGLRIQQSDGWGHLKGGAAMPEVPRRLGRLAADLPPGAESRYWMELFETSDPPDHMWGPEAGSGSYRTLWKREYTVTAP